MLITVDEHLLAFQVYYLPHVLNTFKSRKVLNKNLGFLCLHSQSNDIFILTFC